MKKFLLSAFVALFMALVPATAQELAVYASDSKLSFTVPDNAEEISDTDELIQVQTPDDGFSVVAMPFLLDEFTTDELGETLNEMAVNAGVDLSRANRLQVSNDDIVGEIFAAKDEDGVLYVYSICANNERGYLLQVLALPAYHGFVDRMFETISIEE